MMLKDKIGNLIFEGSLVVYGNSGQTSTIHVGEVLGDFQSEEDHWTKKKYHRIAIREVIKYSSNPDNHKKRPKIWRNTDEVVVIQ